MTDVVDRVLESAGNNDDARRSDARRVLVILTVFMVLAVLANFWF